VNWSAFNSFTIDWDNPVDASGVKGAYYKIGAEPTSNEDGTFTESKPILGLSVPAGGSYAIYVWLKDSVGNTDYHKFNSTVARYDPSPPTGALMINNDAKFTTSTFVNLTIEATDDFSGVAEMCFSNDNETFSSWEAYGTARTWNLTTGDGLKTVYVQFRDFAGRVSNTYNDTIILDTEAPVGEEIVINKNNETTNTTDVLLELEAYDVATSVIEMRFSNDGKNYTDWVPYAVHYNWTLSEGEGTKTVYVQFRDEVGFVSAPISDTIELVFPEEEEPEEEEKVEEKKPEVKEVGVPFWTYVVIAIAIIIALLIGLFIIMRRRRRKKVLEAEKPEERLEMPVTVPVPSIPPPAPPTAPTAPPTLPPERKEEEKKIEEWPPPPVTPPGKQIPEGGLYAQLPEAPAPLAVEEPRPPEPAVALTPEEEKLFKTIEPAEVEKEPNADDAMHALQDARSHIAEAYKAGIDVTELEALFQSARPKLEAGDYRGVMEICRDIKSRVAEAK
jgi:hypothetical protein